MSNGDVKGTLLDAFTKTIQSPVGGWVLACLAFGFMSWWTIQDRKAIYADMAKLREHGMEVILQTHDAVAAAKGAGSENNRLIQESKKVTEENNDILKEIRSMMNLPLENRSDLKRVLKELQQIPKQGEAENINQ